MYCARVQIRTSSVRKQSMLMRARQSCAFIVRPTSAQARSSDAGKKLRASASSSMFRSTGLHQCS
eukprot:749783-Karenia_brevis.AAC.1